MKQKKEVSKVMLVLIVIAIVLYTIADFVLQYFTSIEVSPTLTTCWFTFWGTEIVALAIIKTSKVKHQKDKKDTKDIKDTADVESEDVIINEEE